MMFYLESSSCVNGVWTSWFDRDDPDGLGDDESLRKLQAQYPEAICAWPTKFEARVVSSQVPLDSNLRSVFASHLTGLECLNFIGEPCDDYEIRFCCSEGKLDVLLSRKKSSLNFPDPWFQSKPKSIKT